MGKLTEFSITLANPQAVYFPGQNVEGHVTVVLKEAMKMRGVKLQFQGWAEVKWEESHRGNSHHGIHNKHSHHTERVRYSAHEMYFNFETLLFGPGNDTTTLQPGQYKYPFSYTLPVTCPSSFESDIGQVRYMLKGSIDKPWKFDHTTRKMITVVTVLDLNMTPNAVAPSAGQNSKVICCLCCKSGPISAQFQIDRTGYVPGDSIIIKADISNLSTRTINASKVTIIMSTIYKATRKMRIERFEVCSATHGQIPPGGEDSWSSEPMVVPAVPPSNLSGCSIIDVSYQLILDVIPAGLALSLTVPLDIIIGTIPLRQFIQQPVSGGPRAAMASTSTSRNPALPPSTYAASVFGKVSVDGEGSSGYTRGDQEFTPVYTYYDWSKHQSS